MKFYCGDFNGILEDLKQKIGPTHLTTPREADAWVVFQDCLGSYRSLFKAAKELGVAKPSYCVQHGRGSTSDYGPPNSLISYADKYLCWGKADYDRMVRLGYASKTHIVGCPLNSHIRPRVPHKEKVVLFIPVNTGKEEPENIAVYYELLKIKYDKAKLKVLSHRAALKDKWGFNDKLLVSFNEIATDFDVAAKLLPWHDKNLYHGNTVMGYQDSPNNNALLFNLLRNVDLVVGMDEGTSEIFAMAHDVPVVICDGFKYRQFKANGKDFEVIEGYQTGGAVHCTLDTLGAAVDYALAHPEHLRQERKIAVEAEMGTSYGDATNNIYQYIRKDIKIISKNTCIDREI